MTLALVGILVTATLRAATPLLLAALGGIFSERSGVVNIALEGIMLVSSFVAVWANFVTGSWVVGILGGVVAGVLYSGLHAVASIRFKADQTVSGVALNLAAVGLTEFLLNRVWGQGGGSPAVNRVPDLFGLNLFVYVAFALALVAHWALFKTSWGLRLRAVGEHPLAADTVGVNVAKMRYWGVLLSGALAGLAGASLSIGLLSRFVHGMTAGKGFIALAAVIFGKWNPLGAIAATLLFGVSESLGTIFQTLGVTAIPTQFFGMAPYFLTMLALAGFVGRSTAPAASGVPYEKAH